MSTLERINSLKQKLALGGMIFLATTAASAKSQQNSDASNSVNKEYKIKNNADMDLLLKIFDKEFEESYKILEEKQLTGKKHKALGVPQDGTIYDAVEYDPLEGCSAKDGVIDLETSTIQKTKEGHFQVTLMPDYFFNPEDKPEKPVVISTRDKLSTEQLEYIHANVCWPIVLTDGEHKELLYNCADKLIHGKKLNKNEKADIDKVLNGSKTSYAFYQAMNNGGNSGL